MIDLTEFLEIERPEDTSGDFKALPDGTYDCVVDRVEVRQTSAGDDMLSISYKVSDGKYAGRLIFENLNLWHSESEEAKHIALKNLWSIHEALGFEELSENAEQLVGGPLSVKVKVVKHWSDPDKQVNEITGYKPLNSVSQGDAKPEVTEARAKPSVKKPWER